MRAALLGLALLLLAPGVSAAQDLAAARAFVTGLYAPYRHGDGPRYLDRDAAKAFTPALRALIKAEAAATPAGDVGALDGDPICDCQDFRIAGVRADVTALGPGR